MGGAASALPAAPSGPTGPATSPAAAPSAPTNRVPLTLGDRWSRLAWPLATALTAALVVAPVAFLSVSVLRPSTDVWRQQWATRLPRQLIDTTILLLGVSLGTLLLGASLAWLVSAYRFPGRRTLSWMLIAPLAMPSYVLGFVTVSVMGVAGPVQSRWRTMFGTDAWFPEVRSLPMAVVVFTLVFYPYVYLLALAALRDQAGSAYQVARSLGAGPAAAARTVVLPLLRPALAAGVSVVMMETLTDFATVRYFNIDTVSVGVFRIWRNTFDRDAASEFATLVLAFALIAIGVERVARGRAHFGEAAGHGAGLDPAPLSRPRAWLATAACSFVVLLAFIVPTGQLVVWAVAEASGDRGTPLLTRFFDYLGHSLLLAALTAAVCVVVALVVANAARFSHQRWMPAMTRLTAVGYAVPGPVVAIGVILAVVALDQALGRIGIGLPGAVATGSLVGLVYAYTVRFLAPGLTTIESGLGQVGSEATASARSLGRRPWRVMTEVHTPLARTSIATAAVLVAVDALKELPIVLLLRPFGFDTLSVWTYSLASESRFQQAALPALSIVAVALVPVAVLSRQLLVRSDDASRDG